MAVDDHDWKPFAFKVFVKMPTGKTVTLDTNTDITVASLKKQVCCMAGVPMHQQRLLYADKQLTNSKTLSAYSIKKDRTLTMLLRIRGSGKRARPATLDIGEVVMRNDDLQSVPACFGIHFDNWKAWARGLSHQYLVQLIDVAKQHRLNPERLVTHMIGSFEVITALEVFINGLTF